MLEFLLIPAYAVADSWAGGSLGRAAKRLDEKLPGRAAFWGALLAAVVGFLTIGPWAAAVGLAWLIYRSPGWRVFGGSATPEGAAQIMGTLLRHAMALLALLPVYWAGRPILIGVIAFGAYALAATMLAVSYGAANRRARMAAEPIDPGLNTKVELIRGALFGGAVAASLAPLLAA